MNQIVIGATVPFAVAVLIYACRRGHVGVGFLIAAPLFMTLGGLWAVVPDLPRLWRDHHLYERLSRDPRMNVFFWHYSIDQTESDSRWWLAAFLLMVGAVLFAAWRELRRRESSVSRL